MLTLLTLLSLLVLLTLLTLIILLSLLTLLILLTIFTRLTLLILLTLLTRLTHLTLGAVRLVLVIPSYRPTEYSDSSIDKAPSWAGGRLTHLTNMETCQYYNSQHVEASVTSSTISCAGSSSHFLPCQNCCCSQNITLKDLMLEGLQSYVSIAGEIEWHHH